MISDVGNGHGSRGGRRLRLVVVERWQQAALAVAAAVVRINRTVFGGRSARNRER